MIAGAGAHPQWSAPIGAIMPTTRFKCPDGWLDRPLVGEGAPLSVTGCRQRLLVSFATQGPGCIRRGAARRFMSGRREVPPVEFGGAMGDVEIEVPNLGLIVLTEPAALAIVTPRPLDRFN